MKDIITNLNEYFLEALVKSIRKVFREEMEKIQKQILIPQEEDKFYTIAETAEFLKISVHQMYILNQKRAISYSKPGNTCFYRKADIVEYIESKTIKSRKMIELESTTFKIKNHD